MLAKNYTKLKNSSFIKNMFVIMTGSAVAQIIGFALTPVISRLFSPSHFGVFGSFSAIAGIIIAGVTLEYSQAIMLPKDKESAVNLFGVSLLSTGLVSTICLAICLVIPTAINRVMKTEGAWPLILLVIATAIAGINSSCQSWAIRIKAFKWTSISQVVRSGTSNGSKILFGLVWGGSSSLILSNILADILATLSLFSSIFLDLKSFRRDIRFDRMMRLAKEYRDFPKYSASQNVMNALSSGLPVLLLTKFFGISVAGAYAFGVSVLHVPMSFVMTALRQVLFQKACETQHRGGNLFSLYFKTTLGLFGIALGPTLIMIIWAPQIFALVFGSQWQVAGELARSLIIWLAVVFCNLPAVLFARIIRIQRFVFFYDMALLALRFSVLTLGGIFLEVRPTVFLFSIVGAVMNIFLIVSVGRSVFRKHNEAIVSLSVPGI